MCLYHHKSFCPIAGTRRGTGTQSRLVDPCRHGSSRRCWSYTRSALGKVRIGQMQPVREEVGRLWSSNKSFKMSGDLSLTSCRRQSSKRTIRYMNMRVPYVGKRRLIFITFPLSPLWYSALSHPFWIFIRWNRITQSKLFNRESGASAGTLQAIDPESEEWLRTSKN